MATPEWIDVASRAKSGDGGVSPWEHWEDAGFAPNRTYYFRAGRYRFAGTIGLTSSCVTFLGDGIGTTMLESETPGMPGIVLSDTADGFAMRGMDLNGAGPGVFNPALAVDADTVSISDVRFNRAQIALRVTANGSGFFHRLDISCSVDGGIGIELLDAKGAFFHQINFPMYANNATAIRIHSEGGPGTVDTIHFTDCGMSRFKPDGGTAPSSYAALIVSGKDGSWGEWLKFTNCAFESPTGDVGLQPVGAVSPAIHLTTGRSVTFVNCVITGGSNVVYIRDVVPKTQPTGFRFIGCTLAGSAREAVLHDANIPTQLIGCTVGDASLSGEDVYSGVVLGPNSRRFAMIGGSSGNGILASSGNTQKYGIAISSSADNWFVEGVDCSGNRTGPTSGNVGPTLLAAETIHPSCQIHAVSGSTPIRTIARPDFVGPLTLIPTGNWSTVKVLVINGVKIGNIAKTTTAVAGRAMTFHWVDGPDLWYPSY